uniref:Ricin B lectin domain-containing protein n=1 Tax=Alexandrium catenella TaxID=2925 RepID=A0A7S1MN43_ALECA
MWAVMVLPLVGLLHIAQAIPQPVHTPHPQRLERYLAEDDECSAEAPDTCTFSALQLRGRKGSHVVIEGCVLTNDPKYPATNTITPFVTSNNQLRLGVCVREQEAWIYSLASKTFKHPGAGDLCLTAANEHNVTVAKCKVDDQSQQFNFPCDADTKRCNGSISSVKYGSCMVIDRQHLTTSDGLHTFESDSLTLGDCSITKYSMRDMFDTPKRRQMLNALAELRHDSTPLLLELRTFSSPNGEPWRSLWERRIKLSPQGLYHMATASYYDDSLGDVHRHSLVVSSGTFKAESTQVALMSRRGHADSMDIGTSSYGGWKIVKNETALADRFLGLRLSGEILKTVTEV